MSKARTDRTAICETWHLASPNRTMFLHPSYQIAMYVSRDTFACILISQSSADSTSIQANQCAFSPHIVLFLLICLKSNRSQKFTLQCPRTMSCHFFKKSRFISISTDDEIDPFARKLSLCLTLPLVVLLAQMVPCWMHHRSNGSMTLTILCLYHLHLPCQICISSVDKISSDAKIHPF